MKCCTQLQVRVKIEVDDFWGCLLRDIIKVTKYSSSKLKLSHYNGLTYESMQAILFFSESNMLILDREKCAQASMSESQKPPSSLATLLPTPRSGQSSNKSHEAQLVFSCVAQKYTKCTSWREESSCAQHSATMLATMLTYNLS